MPQVPVYGDQRVQEAGIPNVSMGADASLDAFGGGKALDQSSDAIQGVEKTAFALASEEKQKADSLAAMSFDNQLSQTQTKIQVEASKMLGKDALGAPDYVNQTWNDAVSKIQSQAANDTQKMAVARAASTRFQELNKFAQVHVGDQMQKFADNETQSYIDNSRTAAVQNASDPDKVSAEISRTSAATYDYLSRKGIPLDSDQGKELLQTNLSNLNKSVAQALLDKDSPTNVEDAKAFVEKHQDQFTGQDLIAVRKSVEQAETTSMGLQAWNDMKDWKLSNGDPDIGRMQSAINSRDDLSDERKVSLLNFVDGMGREQMRIKTEQDQSKTRDFENQVITARKQGVPLADALKLAPKYSRDPYEEQTNENAIRKAYAPPEQTDPQTHYNIWEGIQNGTIASTDIDRAHDKGLVNNSDWFSLKQQLFKAKLEGTDPNDKYTDERVKDLAQSSIGSNKDKMSQFMYVYRTQTQNMSADEKYKTAKDLLSDTPDSHWWWSSEKNYQPQFQKLDASNTAWGKVYQDVGDSETKAIGQGILYSGKKSWGLGDVDAFAAQFGGYDNIKGGTPVNTAVQSLLRHGKLATASNVKAVLSKYPDGKY